MYYKDWFTKFLTEGVVQKEFEIQDKNPNVQVNHLRENLLLGVENPP